MPTEKRLAFARGRLPLSSPDHRAASTRVPSVGVVGCTAVDVNVDVNSLQGEPGRRASTATPSARPVTQTRGRELVEWLNAESPELGLITAGALAEALAEAGWATTADFIACEPTVQQIEYALIGQTGCGPPQVWQTMCT